LDIERRFDEDPEPFLFRYTSAALRAEAPLPDCALLRRNIGWDFFGPSRYGLGSTRNVEGAEDWLLAVNGPSFSSPVVLPGLGEWLPSVTRGWHFRIRDEWIICISGGDEPAMCPGYEIVEMPKTVEGFARRADALATAL
jgi:hypothetical protein